MAKLNTEETTIIGIGKTIEEAFAKTAINMFNLVVDTNTVNKINTKTIIYRTKELKSALYLLLKKIYDITSNEMFLLSEVKTINIEEMSNEYLVNVVLLGEKLNSSHKIKDIVKQVTDRNILVKYTKDGCIAQINIIVERRNLEKDT